MIPGAIGGGFARPDARDSGTEAGEVSPADVCSGCTAGRKLCRTPGTLLAAWYAMPYQTVAGGEKALSSERRGKRGRRLKRWVGAEQAREQPNKSGLLYRSQMVLEC